MNYLEYKYIYPPRPEVKSPASGLNTFERMGFIAQAKLNGSCAVLFTDGERVRFMGRHADTFSRSLIPDSVLAKLHRGSGWTVLVGEFMNKSQKDGRGKVFNGTFVLHDILVHESRYLLGMTLGERQALLDELYPETAPFDNFIHQVGESAYRIKNLTQDLDVLWKEVVKVGMYEGFVLKRPTAPLDMGFRPNNNSGWQLKIRKPTKNYSY
jgi:ATP-dependent DNA ligase